MARRRRLPRQLTFTREGRVFVLLTVGVGFAAINTGNNLLYLLLGWMMTAIIASGIMSEQVLRRLRVTRRVPPHVHAGRPFLMEITLENEKRRLPSFSIEIEDLQDGRPIDKRCYFLKVPAGKRQTTRYRHTFTHRGRYELEGFRASTRFPFSLFRKSRELDAPGEVVVYPALLPVKAPPAPPRTSGDDRAPRLGLAGDFFGLREHRDGDDLRGVHWASTARTGRLVVRELEEESHRRATVMVDNGMPPLASDDEAAALERAVSLAASLACDYLERGFQVRVIARGEHLPFGGGPAHRQRVLRQLALLPSVAADTPFAALPDQRSHTLLVTRRGAPPRAVPTGARLVEAA